MEKLTALITTFNEEHNIVECIKSVEFADEILLVDSFSTDKTSHSLLESFLRNI